MNTTDHKGNRAPDDALEKLLRQASPRSRPPDQAEEAARAALQGQWREMTARRRRRRLYWPLAAAASVAVAAGLAFVVLRGTPAVAPPVTLATVETVVGTVVGEGPDSSAPAPLLPLSQLQTGGLVCTGIDSGLGLRWRDGSSVRFDQTTVARLTTAGEVQLESGRLYVDAEDSTGSATPIVSTPAGRVRHVGTQYMTAVSAAGTTVSVRRGRVRLEGPDASAEAEAGEQLHVDVSGTASRRAIATYGDPWQWTQATAAGFAAEGRSVAEFLDWVSRESGRPVAYASAEVRALAWQTRLRGRIDLEPMKALSVILQASDLDHDVRDGALYIRRTGTR
jgi:ferric-dicitrate binding protein FerR (iron transport regulator)